MPVHQVLVETKISVEFELLLTPWLITNERQRFPVPSSFKLLEHVFLAFTPSNYLATHLPPTLFSCKFFFQQLSMRVLLFSLLSHFFKVLSFFSLQFLQS